MLVLYYFLSFDVLRYSKEKDTLNHYPSYELFKLDLLITSLLKWTPFFFSISMEDICVILTIKLI